MESAMNRSGSFGYFIIIVIALFLSLFVIKADAVGAESAPKPAGFSFYGVGAEDTIQSAEEKLKGKKIIWINAKAITVETESIAIDDKFQKLPKDIEEVFSVDKKLKALGEYEKISAMPIDVFDCIPQAPSTFKNWLYYFSGFTKKNLCIIVIMDDFEAVREILRQKYGVCALESYCEKESNIMFCHEQDDVWYIRFFFKDNIMEHYEEVKAAQKEKELNKLENLKEAF
jgi:hypothetical protein